MAPAASRRRLAPQISLTSWILGGSLITNPPPRSSRHRSASSIVKPSAAIAATTEAPPEAKADKPPNAEEKKTGDEGKPSDAEKSVEKVEGKDKYGKAHETNKADEGNGGWTAERDARLLRLKGGNKSWKEIAGVMGMAKSAVVARFKDMQRKEREAEAKAGEKADDEKTEVKGKGDETAISKSEAKDETEEGKGDEKTMIEVEEGASGGRLKADDCWTSEDCEILEMLEARYREQKWLSIQASFYNLTGRMVVSDLIERKFEEVGS